MKNIILSILIMFSFTTKAEISNHEYIFKVKKDSFVVQTSDNENPNPIPNQDCQVQTVNWLNCSTQSSLLTNGQSIEITNTVEEYDGTVTVSCSNGVLSQINPVCEEKSTFNCDDPANVGQRGTDGECEGLLIVNDTTLRTMITNNEDYSGNNIYTGQITSLANIFDGKSVNYDITNWNTKNVTNMSLMFNSSTSFNQAIGNWNVSKVTTMTGMFRSATNFNQPLNSWDVSRVNFMNSMFQNATSFNQPLNNWNISNVTIINGMFISATSFNQSLNNWDTSNVTNMNNTFASAISFNQPLNNWNTSNVTTMNGMFNSTLSFNQNISNWNVNKVSSYTNFKTSSALTDENTPSKFLN